MQKRLEKHFDYVQIKVIKVYTAIVVVGGLYALLLFTTGIGMPCLFHTITGFDCPGCGTSRMVIAAVHMHFADAFNYNPVAFVMFPAWLLLSIGIFLDKPKMLRNERVIMVFLYITIIIYTVFGILRNLPII